jgi:chorismate synthase
VAAGAIAEKILREEWGVEIVAWVSSVGAEQAAVIDPDTVSRVQVDATLSRCPDKPSAERMEKLVREVLAAKDSIGGVVSCVCRNVPTGWGEPVFDKLEAMLAQAMLSLPATKGFEIGSGFAGTQLRGSQHNDPFVQKGDRLGTLTNHAGGVLGGISSGESVLFRVAFKPVATIGQPQRTAGFDGKPVTLEAKGRHDPCVVPRAVPIVESMAALVLLDLAMRQKTRNA